jgi:hypothetical protein
MRLYVLSLYSGNIFFSNHSSDVSLFDFLSPSESAVVTKAAPDPRRSLTWFVFHQLATQPCTVATSAGAFRVPASIQFRM